MIGATIHFLTNSWPFLAKDIQDLVQKLSILGGTDGKNCLNDVEMLQKNASNWREMFPLPHAVKCPAVTPYDEKIFVFGGFSDSYAMCKTVQVRTLAY